jgi:hypothetical protein
MQVIGPVIQGTGVLLTWNVDGAATVNISPGVGSVSASGSVTVNPTVSTTYTLQANTPTPPNIMTTECIQVQIGSPGPVLYVQAQGNCAGSISLNWGAAAFASSYRVQQSPSGAECWSTVGTPSGTSLSVTPPDALAAYDYSIQAYDGLNYGDPGVVVGVVAGAVPSVPTGLTATPLNGRVVLSATASDGATGYNVYRGSTSGAETLLMQGLPSPACSDDGVANGAEYFYTITATTSCGESGQSSEVSARPELALQVYNVETPPNSSWTSS